MGNQCFDNGKKKKENQWSGGNWFSNLHPWFRWNVVARFQGTFGLKRARKKKKKKNAPVPEIILINDSHVYRAKEHKIPYL